MRRRQFLGYASAGVALFSIKPCTLAAGAEVLAPHQKLNIAGIGIGNQGGRDIDAVAKEGHNLVALCDVDESYAAKTFARYPQARRFKDFRVMFDQMGKEIDAVVIGTPDHTHAIVAMEAMRRGKHVYCEKPLARHIGEVRELMAAAVRHKVVTQMGNQGHSSAKIRNLCEWVWAGAIGQVHTVHTCCGAFKEKYSQIRNLEQIGMKHEVPAGLDYNLWTGPAEFRSYSPLWVPYNWRGWRPYGSGCIGDWFCHVMDPAFWALDLDAPSSVLAEVMDYDPAKHSLTFPPGTRITFEFPARKGRGAVKVVWHDGNWPIPRPREFTKDDSIPRTGAILFGVKGMIMHGSHGASGCYLIPESLMNQHSGRNAPAEKNPRVKNHAWDWTEAICNGRSAGSNFGYGGALSQAGLLGGIATLFPGQKLEWDNQAMQFTNHKKANEYVNPSYRNGWSL